MASEQIQVSGTLQQFLHARLDAEMEDSELAYRFITARINPNDEEAHNWFDLKLVGDAARISYTTLTALKKTKTIVEPFASGGHRTVARPASVARRVAAIDDNDGKWGRALDVFANAALASLKDLPEVTLVRGRDIVRRYNEDMHCRCTRLGDLASSCMRYSGYESRFEIYADVAEMAVIICPICKGTRARALVWTDADGKRYLDRAYANPTYQEFLYEWGKSNKITRIWPNTNRRRKPVVIPVPRTDYSAGPYIDSLMYWCRTCHILSNYECPDNEHDKVLLRSTHGQGHTGWWGRCPECHYPFGDSHRRCPNRRACQGCGHTHCSNACPNGCWDCEGCGLWMKKHHVACTNGCAKCTSCGFTNSKLTLLAQHGHCRRCSKIIEKEMVHEVPLIWQDRHTRWTGTCPSCQYVVRVVVSQESVTPKKDEGLISCRYVHDGHASSDSGHCPGCHAVIRWKVEPRPKGGTPTGGFRKTPHQPTMWKREGRGFGTIARTAEEEDYLRYVSELWRTHKERG